MSMFGIMEFIMPLFFILFFVLFFGIILKNIAQWNKNNHSPRLTVDASVVTKRYSRSHNAHTHTSSTHYYVTFQVQSGDRMELSTSGSEYGMLAEGDRGQLTFQGTRYLDFQRQVGS